MAEGSAGGMAAVRVAAAPEAAASKSVRYWGWCTAPAVALAALAAGAGGLAARSVGAMAARSVARSAAAAVGAMAGWPAAATGWVAVAVAGWVLGSATRLRS